MVQTPDGDPSRASTELIARLLLESARQDPALLGRSNPPRGTPVRNLIDDIDRDPILAFPMLSEAPQPLPLRTIAPPDVSHEFEDLVSLAVASARQAEDASDEARAASIAARRNMRIMAGVGLLGILLGVAAIADNHLSGSAPPVAPTAMAGPAIVPGDPVPSTGENAAGPTQQAKMLPPPNAAPEAEAAAPPAAANTSAVLIQAATAQPASRPILPPVYHAPQGGFPVHSAPWPNDRPAHYPYRTAVTRRVVVVPPFLVALRRDISSLFRGFPPHS